MSALSFFAPRSLPPDLAAKTRSLTCLSLLCFALADVRDGLGPFLGIFLQSHGWTPDSIGYVMTIGGLAGMAVTAPLGALGERRHISDHPLPRLNRGGVGALARIVGGVALGILLAGVRRLPRLHHALPPLEDS